MKFNNDVADDISRATDLLTAAYSFDVTQSRLTAANIADALEKISDVQELVKKIIYFKFTEDEKILDLHELDRYFLNIEKLLAEISMEVHKEISTYCDERGKNLADYLKARRITAHSIIAALTKNNPAEYHILRTDTESTGG